jgi:hypothetical protein
VATRLDNLAAEAELWRATHASWPKPDELFGATGTHPVDLWGQPFRIELSGATWIISSAGIDGAFGTGDDLRRIAASLTQNSPRQMDLPVDVER